jgi:hypothetical protein
MKELAFSNYKNNLGYVVDQMDFASMQSAKHFVSVCIGQTSSDTRCVQRRTDRHIKLAGKTTVYQLMALTKENDFTSLTVYKLLIGQSATAHDVYAYYNDHNYFDNLQRYALKLRAEDKPNSVMSLLIAPSYTNQADYTSTTRSEKVENTYELSTRCITYKYFFNLMCESLQPDKKQAYVEAVIREYNCEASSSNKITDSKLKALQQGH